MDAKREENLADREFTRLERRVGQLMDHCQRLEKENRLLRSQQEAWALERATLMSRQDHARTQVEAMIMRVKSLEDSL